jgi:hypothetical protein
MYNLIEFLRDNDIAAVNDPITIINDALELRKYQDYNSKPKTPILPKNPTANSAGDQWPWKR